jgi:hypothetical protein
MTAAKVDAFAHGAAIHSTGRRVWHKASSVMYLPALVVPALAMLLVGIGWANEWGGVDFAGSLTSLRTETFGPLAGAMIALLLVVERVRPAQASP